AGPITKHESLFSFFFGGTSAEMTRQAVLYAVADDSVSAIMLKIDSPGGHVAGVQSLADTVFRARKSKAIHAHIDDLAASAAYWIGSQANTITANSTAEIGSIGTIAVVHDLSGAASAEGIKVHVITSRGAETHKGAGVPGTEVTDVQLEELQQRVDDINAFFLRSVRRGRLLIGGKLDAVADGRVHIAGEAKKLGLIDQVMSFDAALRHVQGAIRSARAQREARVQRVTEKRAELQKYLQRVQARRRN
ncbi:MAG: S49 family peptidase, partial [bacterium]|nr:S49 family peptidase [bacterium]